MKKMICVLLISALAFSLCACSSGKSNDTAQESNTAAEELSAPEETPAENADVPSEGTGSEETEEAVSEDVASSYGLTVEEFMALKAAVQTHIDSEWNEKNAYFDMDSSIDLAGSCDAIRRNISEDFMDDAAIENFINNELDMSGYSDRSTDLWKERITVLAHAVNDWAAKQNVDYDKYSNVWEKLADYIIIYNMAVDDSGIAPLFDLEQ